MLRNLGAPELLIIAVWLGLLILWVMGVIKLFQKGHTTLGWISIIGLIVPVIALVGYAGWFVQDRAPQS